MAAKIPFQLHHTMALEGTFCPDKLLFYPSIQTPVTKQRRTQLVSLVLRYSSSMGHKNYMYFTQKRLSEEENLWWSVKEKKKERNDRRKKVTSELPWLSVLSLHPVQILNTALAVPLSC